MQERDGAVDPAAHGNGAAIRLGRGVKDLPERVRERVRREPLAGHRRRLEQRQALERPLEPLGVSFDDPIALEPEPDERELAVPRGIPHNLDHQARLAAWKARRTITQVLPQLGGRWKVPHPAGAPRPKRTWHCQVGVLPISGNALAGRGLPFTWCWFYFENAALAQGRARTELTGRRFSGRTPI